MSDDADPIFPCCDLACLRDEIRLLTEAVRSLAADIRALRQQVER